MIILFVFNIITALIVASFDIKYLYSFELSFICSLMIFFVSFKAMQKKINSIVDLSKNDLIDYDNMSKKEKFFIGSRISFGFFRVMSYLILCFCVIGLVNNELFFIIPFIIGTLISSLSLVIYLLMK